MILLVLQALCDFNSHAHVERDVKINMFTTALMISTHTLTWSVTNRLNIAAALVEISTHTLTWSVTSLHRFSTLLH